MQGLAVVVIPVLLMLFALAMERVESRLHRLSLRESEVQEFLEQANASDVGALATQGMPHALARFQRRRRATGSDTDDESGSADAGNTSGRPATGAVGGRKAG